MISTAENKEEYKEEQKVKCSHQQKEMSTFMFCCWGVFVLVKELCLDWRDDVEVVFL